MPRCEHGNYTTCTRHEGTDTMAFAQLGNPPTLVIGVDPGPVVGICALSPARQGMGPVVMLAQADPDTALWLIKKQVTDWQNECGGEVHVVAERFVDGRRSARVAGRHGSQTAKNVLGALGSTYQRKLRLRSAADVKPWASDTRLAAAGIQIANPSTMRHALDAGRHALYSAVWDHGWPDPLIGRAASTPGG